MRPGSIRRPQRWESVWLPADVGCRSLMAGRSGGCFSIPNRRCGTTRATRTSRPADFRPIQRGLGRERCRRPSIPRVRTEGTPAMAWITPDRFHFRALYAAAAAALAASLAVSAGAPATAEDTPADDLEPAATERAFVLEDGRLPASASATGRSWEATATTTQTRASRMGMFGIARAGSPPTTSKALAWAATKRTTTAGRSWVTTASRTASSPSTRQSWETW